MLEQVSRLLKTESGVQPEEKGHPEGSSCMCGAVVCYILNILGQNKWFLGTRKR